MSSDRVGAEAGRASASFDLRLLLSSVNAILRFIWNIIINCVDTYSMFFREIL